MKKEQMMKLEKRMEVERMVVRKLVRVAKAKGWVPHLVDDGGELVKVSGESDVMDAVFAVEMARIFFRKSVNGALVAKGWAFIVLGNDGWDAICDNSIGPFNDEVVEEVFDWIRVKEEA